VPLYEYACPACDAHFEELMSVNSSAEPSCPRCGRNGCRRVMSATSSVRPGQNTLPRFETHSSGCGGGGGFS
jgi:putative FmdB family regulatory protein